MKNTAKVADILGLRRRSRAAASPLPLGTGSSREVGAGSRCVEVLQILPLLHDVSDLWRRRSRATASSLPPRTGSSRKGGAGSRRVKVLQILPLLRAPSLSSSFSLDASSLVAARLIPR
ncbi:hypothetical protein B296_00042988 [Ensete ventricosum]|uniref:Uncharacterized protein n=1 Tax=Ensete ventricosum TaxID=4639 RepID=A0A426YYA4_ENSVE|nr:hypothetical protein B296_00042988 [Ensete ventricosum]